MSVIIPHSVQFINARPTDPEPSNTPFGEIKIPDPETNKND